MSISLDRTDRRRISGLGLSAIAVSLM